MERRVRRIDRWWQRARYGGRPRRWRRDEHFAHHTLLILLPLIFSLPLELTLITGRVRTLGPFAAGSGPDAPFVALFVVVWLIDGLLMTGLLLRRARGRPGAVATLCLVVVAGFPLFGFLAVPWLDRWAAHLGRRSSLPPRHPAMGWAGRWLRRIEGSVIWLVWLFAVNLLLVIGAVDRIVVLAFERPEVRWLLPVLAGLLHGVAGAAAYLAVWRRRELRRVAKGFRILLPICITLLPAVAALLVLGLLVLHHARRGGDELLVPAAYADVGTGRRFRRWSALDAELSADWHRSPRWRRLFLSRGSAPVHLGRGGRMRQREVSFVRLKLLAGFCSAIALGRAAAPVVSCPDHVQVLELGVSITVLVCASLFLLRGILWLVERWGLTPWDTPPEPSWRLFLATAVLGLGLLQGLERSATVPLPFSPLQVLALGGILLVAGRLIVLPLWHRGAPRMEEAGLVLWVVLFLAVLAVVAAARADAGSAVRLERTLVRLGMLALPAEWVLGARAPLRRRPSLFLPCGVLMAAWWRRGAGTR